MKFLATDRRLSWKIEILPGVRIAGYLLKRALIGF